MPRFKQKGTLERTVDNDLWKHTLSHIPTTFGRLFYLASLRDVNSGIYRHHGLISTFGRDESMRALRENHEKNFVEWLGLTMEEKYDDLVQHLEGLDDPAQIVVEHWLRSRIYRAQIPSSASEMERELFCSDLEALLEAIKNAEAA